MTARTIVLTKTALSQLKDRLDAARRVYKLLKDKHNELTHQYADIVKRSKELSTRVDEGLSSANVALTVASAIMSPEALEQALLYTGLSGMMDLRLRNISAAEVPLSDLSGISGDPSKMHPYGFAQTSGELDDALTALSEVYQDILELEQTKEIMRSLTDEIKKTCRRINAIAYVEIPELDADIKYTTLRLEDLQKYFH